MHLLWISVMVYNFISGVEGQTCTEKGWFGTNCTYKCHCTNDNCDFTTGECGDNSVCVQGWFGPQCQYVDLTTTMTTGTGWLYDGDDTTCNDGQQQSVTVELNYPVPFTWLRLYFKYTENTNTVDVQFRASPSGNVVTCDNKKTAAVNGQTLDIHCYYLDVLVQHVTVTGQGVRSLCSVYISGGRNVALKQSTKQSSTYNGGQTSTVSSNAVDGNRDGNWTHGSCTQTDSDRNPYWTVAFKNYNHHSISRLVLYNRNDGVSLPERLKNFNVTMYSVWIGIFFPVFTYQDNTTATRDVYTIILNATSATDPMSVVSIGTTHIIAGDTTPVLTLCEVEIYGDITCPEGSYGRECEHSCNYCRNQTCFDSTGGCPDGCADVGVIGDRCQTTCPSTYTGPDCKTRCSINCRDQLCDRVTGVCLQCPPGRKGSQCEEVCPHPTYGQDCKENCSTNCVDQECNIASGVCDQCPFGKMGDQCDQCPPGKIGDLCDQECESETYGQDCQETCSEHCLRPTGTIPETSACDAVNGTCIFGCVNGYVGPMCLWSKQDSSSDSGVGMGIGIGVGICVLIAVVVVVGVYCYWKRSQNTRSRCQRPPGYEETDLTRQDDHNYRELFRGNDDYNLPTDEVSQEVKSRRKAKTDCAPAAYENTVLNHYEDITGETSMGEPDGGYPNDLTETSGEDGTDGGYFNCAETDTNNI